MRGKTLTVIWGVPGVPCPMVRKIRVIDKKTGRDTTMIYEEPQVVPNNLYYRRRIRVGDLALVKDTPPKLAPKRATRVKATAMPAERKDD